MATATASKKSETKPAVAKTEPPIKDAQTGKEATAPARVSMSVTRLRFVGSKVDATARTLEEALAACDEMLAGREESQNVFVVQLREIREVLGAVKLDEAPAKIEALIRERQEFI